MDRWVPALLSLAFAVAMLTAVWKVFTKAGEKGWKSLIPIYGGVVFLRIVERPWWMLLLLMIPGVNLFPYIIVCIDLARVFGKGSGFAAGLTFLTPVFLMMLAFGDAKYQRVKTNALSPELVRLYPDRAA